MNNAKTANNPISKGKLTGNTCLCRGCGEIFQSINGFDKHRVGFGEDKRCMTILEMETKGMVINKSGRWGTSAFTREVRK